MPARRANGNAMETRKRYYRLARMLLRADSFWKGFAESSVDLIVRRLGFPLRQLAFAKMTVRSAFGKRRGVIARTLPVSPHGAISHPHILTRCFMGALAPNRDGGGGIAGSGVEG